MSGYTKLWSDIIASSVWNEDDKTRIVWITLLASMDAVGFVSASVGGLAHLARVDIDSCRRALESFMSPDPDSKRDDCEGRRIEKVAGGFRIINSDFYRNKRDPADRKKYMREYMQEYRENPKHVNNSVNNVNVGKPQLTQAEAEAEAYKSYPASNRNSIRALANSVSDEWIAQLKSKPVYQGIDIDKEFGKCQVWYETNQKTLSRRRFINWLGGADKTLKSKSSGKGMSL